MTQDRDDQIIRTGSRRGLSRRASGLVRRGLEDLSKAEGAPLGRVLLVEDDPLILEAIEGMLARLGYQVCSTDGDDEAIRIAHEFRPQVALLGYVMPGMGGPRLGVELFRSLPNTKIVFCTEVTEAADLVRQRLDGRDASYYERVRLARAEDLERLRSDGCDFAVLPAPFSLGELRERVASWLDGSSGRAEAKLDPSQTTGIR